jgi:hypothetical protein
MAMTMQVRGADRDDNTVYGFRSTLREWASEQTSFPRDKRDSASPIGACWRDDQLEKHRKLMEAMAAVCRMTVSNVVAFE